VGEGEREREKQSEKKEQGKTRRHRKRGTERNREAVIEKKKWREEKERLHETQKVLERETRGKKSLIITEK
jgi:hypothetical protein